MMELAMQCMTWEEIVLNLTEEFMSWGCPYSKKSLPKIAMGYDCTPLFFWNWIDNQEIDKNEKGFLRVLGYAWRKHLANELETNPWYGETAEAA